MATDSLPMKGIGWSAAQAWTCHVIKLGVLMALARLLPPHDFGVFAISAGLLGILQLFANQGLTAAIVQRPELEDGHLIAARQRVLAVNAGLVLVALAAGLVTAHTGQPAVGFVLIVLGIGLPIDSLGTLALAARRRKLDFRSIAIAAILGETAGALAAILCALNGGGVWSLVARQLTVQAVVFAVTFRRAAFRFRGTTRRHHGELASLGRMIAFSNILVMLRGRLDEPLVGLLVGLDALGFYSIARRLVASLAAVLPDILANYAWPLLAAQQTDRPRFEASLLSITRLVAYVVWPAFAIFAATDRDWVPLFVGHKWLPLLPIMDGLCLVSATRALVGVQISALLATGRARERFIIEIFTTAIVVVAIAAGAAWSAAGIAWSVAAVTLLIAPFEIILVARWLDLSPRLYTNALRRPLAAASLLTVLLTALSLWSRGRMNTLQDLVALLTAGLVCWLLALRVLAPDLIAAAVRRLGAGHATRRAVPD